jgi:hypothetical protein
LPGAEDGSDRGREGGDKAEETDGFAARFGLQQHDVTQPIPQAHRCPSDAPIAGTVSAGAAKDRAGKVLSARTSPIQAANAAHRRLARREAGGPGRRS